jgi:hypothetical protein
MVLGLLRAAPHVTTPVAAMAQPVKGSGVGLAQKGTVATFLCASAIDQI